MKDALENLSTRKATGYDGIQPRILKLIAEELAPSLTRIFNTSIDKGHGYLIGREGNGYQSIRVIAEKKKRITDQLQFYQLLTSCLRNYWVSSLQSTWIPNLAKNSGCDTTLLRLIEKWKMDLDSRQVVGVLSSDMSKAFDSVSPPLLIKKLESYNFLGSTLNLLCFYFSHSQNRIKLGSVTSRWKNTIRGCPLGSLFVPFCGTHFKMILLIRV